MPTKTVKPKAKLRTVSKGNDTRSNGNRDLQKTGQKSQKDELLLVSQEIKRLADASREGLLSERGRADQFTGAHREMVLNINEMLDAIIGPLNVSSNYVERIS